MSYLENYLDICNRLMESADLLHSYLTEMKLSGLYDECMLGDAIEKFDQDVAAANGLQYMGIGTRIKRMAESLDE